MSVQTSIHLSSSRFLSLYKTACIRNKNIQVQLTLANILLIIYDPFISKDYPIAKKGTYTK